MEEQFYVALAVLVAVCVRRSRPERTLAIVFAGVVCGSVGLANVVSDWHPRLEFGTDVRAAGIWSEQNLTPCVSIVSGGLSIP